MKAISLILLALLLASCSSPQAKNDSPIDSKLHARQASYRQCYIESDSYQGKQDKTIGRVTVRFLISKEGLVKDASISQSDFKDANFHACLLDQIRQIKFDKVENELDVVQPIRFTPVEQ
jgi:TonB family protein